MTSPKPRPTKRTQPSPRAPKKRNGKVDNAAARRPPQSTWSSRPSDQRGFNPGFKRR